MKYGFTGTQIGVDDNIILHTLKTLKLKSGDLIVTGACIGVDAQVSILAKLVYPNIEQLILVPANKSKVDTRVYNNGKVIYMPQNTDYRYRNEQIIKNSDKLIAFWTGKKAYSGTYMTINIAKKENTPIQIINL